MSSDISTIECVARDVGRTLFFEKLARCLAMHSSYRAGDHGENVSGSFATRSRTAGGATSPVISRYRSLAVGSLDFLKPVDYVSATLSLYE
jgi:hypothetical protein